jgi:negative regulator of flagellin synthesis FlgM
MIDPVSPGPVNRISGAAPPRAAPAAMPVSDQAGNAASLPTLLSLAAQLAEQGPPVDYPRIAQLRQAIADASYSVDPDRIAQSILAFHADRVP